MAILALDWYIWVALGLLFLYALLRRLLRSWQAKRRQDQGRARASRSRTGRG